MAQKIQSEEIKHHIENLEGWGKVEGRDAIHKKFKFKDSKAAFEFMRQIAVYAEEINHHPEWANTYNCVDVTLSTHDVNGLSMLDLQMAAKMNSII